MPLTQCVPRSSRWCHSGDNDTNGNTNETGTDRNGKQSEKDEGPQDQDLDIEQSHPEGAVLRVHSLAFEDDNLVVDYELINSSEYEITFHLGSTEGSHPRLVDDAGQRYDLVKKDDEEIKLESGDSDGGTLTFQGPLHDDFDIKDAEGQWSPEFLVPIDLT